MITEKSNPLTVQLYKKKCLLKFVFILLIPQRLIENNNVPRRINDEILYVLKFIM